SFAGRFITRAGLIAQLEFFVGGEQGNRKNVAEIKAQEKVAFAGRTLRQTISGRVSGGVSRSRPGVGRASVCGLSGQSGLGGLSGRLHGCWKPRRRRRSARGSVLPPALLGWRVLRWRSCQGPGPERPYSTRHGLALMTRPR